jgi:hypothetical protein
MKLLRNILLFVFLTLFSNAAFGSDSLYVYSHLNFKLKSANGLTLQKQYPRESSYFKGCMEYDYCEGQDSNDFYLGEITVLDCRTVLEDSSPLACNLFFQRYKKYVTEHRDPVPDTAYKFRNMDAIKGHGELVSGALHGTKKQKYVYVDFMHNNIIYSLCVFDTKQNVNQSLTDFLNRFEFVE